MKILYLTMFMPWSPLLQYSAYSILYYTIYALEFLGFNPPPKKKKLQSLFTGNLTTLTGCKRSVLTLCGNTRYPAAVDTCAAVVANFRNV